MGLFKSIKKIGKKILKGAKKVFKKAKKFVGKIAGSKWGKMLMIAGAVVMGGIAVYGAYTGVTGAVAGAAQAGTQASFMTKFAAGAKGALSAMANPVATGQKMLGAASQVGTGVQVGTAPVSYGGLGSATPLPAGTTLPPASASGGGGFLSKAGGAVMDFAKSAGGGQVISGAVQGYAEQKAAEEERKAEEEARTWQSRSWENAPSVGAGGGYSAGVGAPQSRPRPSEGMLSRTQSMFTPSPREQVASYARGY